MKIVSETARHLANELWLSRRLRAKGIDIFQGDTAPAIRRDRARRAITEHKLEAVIAGRAEGGKPRTYAEVFQSLYGEPL